MELRARITKQGNQIIITKRMQTFDSRVSLSDAKRLHERGAVSKTNRCFDRLVEHHFDAEATLEFYRDERARIAGEKKNVTE